MARIPLMRASMKRTILLAALTACSSATPSENTENTASAVSACERDGRLTVMTQNVYLGADIDPILGAQHEADVPPAVAAAWAQMQGNDFHDRAKAIAASVAHRDPAVIGLQEVALFRRFSHAGGAPEEIDFLEILKGALHARGLHYRAVVVQTDSDVTVPMLAGIDPSGAPIIDAVQMIDREVILVREGVTTSKPRSGRYAVSLPVELADEQLEIIRGWASVVVHTESGRFRFITTHLEDHVPEIQAAQVAELLGITSAESLPIVLTGDFNSAGDGSTTPTYGTVRAAGFQDAWHAARPHDPGFSCCRAADLHVANAKLDQRIDFVVVRGSHNRPIPGLVTATLVGDALRDRTREGLWPSDHAGIVTTFRPPSAW